MPAHDPSGEALDVAQGFWRFSAFLTASAKATRRRAVAAGSHSGDRDVHHPRRLLREAPCADGVAAELRAGAWA